LLFGRSSEFSENINQSSISESVHFGNTKQDKKTVVMCENVVGI